jgi:hypothetical protein
MKIAKKIEIMKDLTATLLVDVSTGSSMWILHIKKDGNIVRAKVDSSTVVALMMAERDMKAYVSGFYEVNER